MGADKSYALEKVLIREDEIKSIVKTLAGRINEDYKGKKLIIIGVLKGAFVFLSDLVREIKSDVQIEFIKASSYGSKTISTGEVNTEYVSFSFDVAGTNLLIVDDILDTGHTLTRMMDMFREKNAASVELCVFLDKVERRQVPLTAKYTGKVIPDEFVVGYGLDFNESHRNLPYIAVVNTSKQ